MEMYANFDLRVTVPNKVMANSELGEVDAEFDLDLNAVKLACSLIDANQVNRGLLENFGEILYTALFPAPVSELFHRALTQIRNERRKLRIRLTFDSPELAALPWEFLYYRPTDLFLANTPELALSRYVRVQDRREITKTNRLGVLIIISAPQDQAPLDISAEERTVVQALEKTRGKGVALDVDVVRNATLKAISRQLSEKIYHAVHFIGHGTFENETGYIALVDDAERTRLIDDKTFDMLFLGKRDISLVILNACKTAAASSARAFSGLATSLVKRGVPAVIAMQYSVFDEIALLFAEEFYYHFAKGRPIDQIIQDVRRLVALETEFSSRDFGVPVLFMRSENGILLELGEAVSEPETVSSRGTPEEVFPGEQEHLRRSLDDMKFVNRVFELNQLILNPAGPPYLEIYAPAGYGKTCLLNKAVEYYCAQEDSVYALANFNVPALRYDKRAVLGAITGEIAGQLSDSATPASSVDEFAAQLAKQKGIRRVVIFFDASESASDELMDWILNGLIPDLARGLSKRHISLKVVVSGKYEKPELKQYRPDYQFEAVRLSPFDEKVIREMVEDGAAIVGATLSAEQASEIAQGVFEITHGHPKCAQQLIVRMALAGFDSPEVLFADRREIFSDVLNTVEAEIIGETTIKIVTREIRHVFEPLCVFRRFLPGDYTLKPLIDDGFIRETFHSPSEIVEKLLKTYLVSWQGRMYLIDPLVRRVLSMKIELFEPERFEEITDLAARLYDSWIIGQDFSGNDYPIKSKDESQADFIDEALYHHAKLLQVQGRNSKADLEELKGHLSRYRSHLRSSYGQSHLRMNVQYLRNQLLEDIELQKILYALFGSSFQEFLAVLE